MTLLNYTQCPLLRDLYLVQKVLKNTTALVKLTSKIIKIDQNWKHRSGQECFGTSWPLNHLPEFGQLDHAFFQWCLAFIWIFSEPKDIGMKDLHISGGSKSPPGSSSFDRPPTEPNAEGRLGASAPDGSGAPGASGTSASWEFTTKNGSEQDVERRHVHAHVYIIHEILYVLVYI